jgi:putative ABC transport system permease protein
MFKNYLKVGIRNILKYKLFSFINIFGLSLALSVCMLIFLMLADQKRYDQFHFKKDRIYRILSYGNFRLPYATTPYPVANTLKTEYPIIEEATNLTPGIGGDATYHQRIVEMCGYFTDPSFFHVFSFELEQGDKNTALAAPNSMVITRKLAKQLFQDEDPIGKVIEFADRQLAFPQESDGIGSPPVQWGSFAITGVIDETRYKSHLRFDVLVSSSSQQTLYLENKIEDNTNNWERYFRTYTYVLLNPNKDRADLSTALIDLVADKYVGITAEETKGFKLVEQKLSEIQLDLTNNDTGNRFPRLGYYFLSFLAAVIMLSACLNYTNLSVARALTRAKEIGVRKVTGANRKNLILQFLSESIITALLALTMAVVLLLFIRPAFKGLWINQYLNFELPSTILVYIIFAAFAVLVGILAGVYPALHLSAYQPIKALKNLNSIRPRKLGMRKALTITQFAISLFFITTSILILNQFNHFIKFDYGFNSHSIVNIELQGSDYRKLVNELSAVHGVSTISACDYIPATGTQNGISLKRSGTEEEPRKLTLLLTDENFVDNLEIKLIAGKHLMATSDSSDQFILVNEAAVKAFGYEYPSEIIGQVFETRNKEMLQVIGVIKDFSLRIPMAEDKINPLIMRNSPFSFKYVNVRIMGDPSGIIPKLEQKWKSVDQIHPFKYEFFDDQLAQTHQAIFDAVTVLGFIALLAIVIACLGLLGMVIYTAERKTKEVGIRKILGAEDLSIVLLLSKGFFKMLLVSVFIGAPLSYFMNNLWLQKLPNRIEFGFGTVFLGTLIMLVLGLLTIGSQMISVSKGSPIDSLKND